MIDLIRRGDALAAYEAAADSYNNGRDGRWFRHHLADAIAALPAVTVGVKPLVWHEGDEPDEWKSGPYDVWCEFGKFQLYYWAIVLGEPHETADAAKAAAYAHHRARIRAALEPLPAVDPAAIRAAALREAEEALRDWQDSLNTHRSTETAITVGMAADVVLDLIDKEPGNE